ncbi:heterogeneous nuclear ribonucleoprotein U isoform X2 [Pseudomyrmex gracilis]|uniref:heterogeneous nuclear ribonucleoprotein U isoform X2 n=1 Tax=Pseudomyrmex gracilis TaxID=219809 RepID=UPI000995D2F8|nr:heterogeneous nuclear ribonucleoprotein U isoform X2 [Pseudomyrmex gracilis]
MDPAKLKVVDLRSALAERGLDTKGNKPVLVERLRKALEEETYERNQEKSSLQVESTGEDFQERVAEAARSSQSPRTPSRASRSSSMTTPTKISTRNASRMATTPNSTKMSASSKFEFTDKTHEVLAPMSESVSEESVVQQEEEIAKVSPEKPIEKQDYASECISQNEIYSSLSEKSQEDKTKHILEDNKYEVNVSQVPVTKPSEKPSTIECVDQFSKTQEEHEIKISNVDEEKLWQTQEPVAEDTTNLEEDIEMKEDVDKDNFKQDIDDKDLIKNENIQDTENSYNTKDNVDIPEVDKSTDITVDQINKTDEIIKFKEKEKSDEDYTAEDEKMDSVDDVEDVHEKTEEDISQVEKTAKMIKMEKEDTVSHTDESKRKECNDMKRKRSVSPSSSEVQQTSPVSQKPEDEPDLDKYNVILSWYDSDLNLIIDKEGFVCATPMHTDDFCHMWAGARASYGFISGKVYYEAKITEHFSTAEKDEKYSSTLRIGWSAPYTSMQLGEDKLSYAYTSTGQKGTDGKFVDYGSKFGKDDVVGCYLDMTHENIVELTYTVNGKDLGSAFSVSKEELGDKPLFPHILSKNCTFVCNFGQEEAWCERIPEYTVVGDVELQDRVPGPCRPDEKADCEMIMMCGLPAAGKTTWARKHAAEHSDKLYNILALHKLLEKTRDVSLSDQEEKVCPKDIAIDKCNRALDQLIDVASSRRRNYILEQKSNVYFSVQRRKMRNFCGYQRKAVVVIPTDEEYKQRLSTHDAIERNTSSNIDELKANFAAPSAGESFDEVEWIGLDEENGKKLIEKYNKEGKEAGFNQQPVAKRSRFDNKSESNRNIRDSRNNRDNRRNNYQDRSRNSVWRGAGMGGWRGDRPQRGGYMRHAGSYGPPHAPWRLRGRGGPAMIRGADRRHGGIERRAGNDRNRHVSPRQGNWGSVSNYQGSQQSSWNQPDSNWSSSSQPNSQASWSQQSGGGGGWGGQWGGGWKGYGQSNTYGQAYNQGYGNGNWNWNQQYYNNQYWDQQQQSGQTTATGGGQAASKQ